jgi:hypothetical protein
LVGAHVHDCAVKGAVVWQIEQQSMGKVMVCGIVKERMCGGNACVIEARLLATTWRPCSGGRSRHEVSPAVEREERHVIVAWPCNACLGTRSSMTSFTLCDTDAMMAVVEGSGGGYQARHLKCFTSQSATEDQITTRGYLRSSHRPGTGVTFDNCGLQLRLAIA